MKKTSLKLKSALAALTLVTLGACGGGGGGAPAPVATTTPPTVITPATPTVVDTTAPTIALSSATTLIDINSGLEFTTSELIVNPKVTVIQTGTTTAFTGSVVIKVGTDNKTFTWTPSTPLPYGTSFTASASVLDLANNVGKLEVKFTTAIDTNVALRDEAKGKIIPQGVQKVVPSVELVSTCLRTTDACFYQAVQNGTVLLIDTGVKRIGAPDANRDIIYGVYRQNGKHYIKMMHKDDLTGAFPNPPFLNTNYNETWIGLFGSVKDRFQGATDGLLFRGFNGSTNQNECYVSNYQVSSGTFGNDPSAACPVWN